MALLDDIIYISLLIFSIYFGKYYREIRPIDQRQLFGTLLGFTIVAIVSGWHLIHPIICALANAIIISKLSPKICHLISFYFTFGYLFLIFRLAEWYGYSNPSGHTNLIQMMMTLKLVGLAFEKNSAATASEDDSDGAKSKAMEKITFMDVIHYSFNYIGVLTGPYYRYRTYWDSLYRPFAEKADHANITLTKLKEIALYVIIYLTSNYLFPAMYANTKEFSERSFLYRIWYIYPTFLTFRMRMYIGMMLSECVCQMAGLGAYPVLSEPAVGHGPKNYKKAISLSNEINSLKQDDFNYETIHNMNVPESEKCFLVRDAMKLWNTCIQYWMAVVVYKRFPHRSRGVRTAAVMLLCAMWHGYYAGYYFTIFQITFFLPMEDIYMKFYKNSPEGSLNKKALFGLLWCLRLSCMSYLGITFQLLTLESSLQFYKNVYFSGHLLVAFLYLLGRYIHFSSKVKKS